MPKNPSLTRKTAKQTKAVKTSKGKTGDEPKSKDPEKLKEYLKQVLLDNKTSRTKTRHCPQLPKIGATAQQSTNAFRNQLREVIDYCTTELSVEEKTDYLLNVARTPKLLADEFRDSLVDEARELLLSLAYRELADSFIGEAQQAEPISYDDSTVVQTLLKGTGHQNPSVPGISEEEWGRLLTECKDVELLCLFKYFIRGCGKRLHIDTYRKQMHIFPLHPAKHFVVRNHSVKGMALLLRDEVEQAVNKPGSFFSNTDLGSLLSLNTVIHRNRGIQPCSLEHIVSEMLLQKIRPLPLSEIMECNNINQSEITTMVTKALTNILNSGIDENQRSVFAWMAAVINSNRPNQSQDPQDQSHDAYMMTFSTVLLHTWEACSINLTESGDFRLYCSRDCSVYPKGEVSLTGEDIQIVGESCCFPLSGTQIARKLFLCCLQALDVCLLPVLHRYLEQSIPELPKQENPDDFRKLLHLDKVALRDETFHRLVAQLYIEQCELLLQLLKSTENEESSAAGSTRNNLSLIPAFFVVGMTDWVHLLFQVRQDILKACRGLTGIENCLDLCIRLLEWRHFAVISSPNIGFSLIRTLSILGSCIDRKDWVIKKLIQEAEQVLPSMLTIYTKSDANDYNVWGYIACFINYNFEPDLQKILHEKCETDMFKEFLESFLLKLQIFINEHDSLLQNHLENSETRKQLDRIHHLLTHVIMLSKLTGDELIHPMFCAPSMYSQTYSTLRRMADFLSRLTTPGSYDSVKNTPKNEIKRALGHGVQILLGSVKRFGPQQDLSEIYHQLKPLLEDEFFRDKKFTKVMDMIKYATAIDSEDEKESRMEEESWMTESLNTPLDEDALLEAFHTRLQPFRLITARLLQSHSFQTDIRNGTIQPKTHTNLKWQRQCWERTSFFNPSSAAFLVLDTERMDVMRFVMSGPTGTPYSRGLFVFDIFCPADYPSVPPRVRLVSTVDGAVFFGSHVERNNVSFMSLLKEHSHGNSINWSINKIFQYVKNMMLTAMKEGTQDGEKCTKERPRRLCQVRAQTIRHAMLEPLKKPPVGLKEVVGLYFVVQKQALLKQCARWVHDCTEDEEIKKCVGSLYTKLQELGRTSS